MTVDPEVRRQALSCLLLGFVGAVPPSWLLQGLHDGLGGVVLFGSNVGDGTRVKPLTERLTAAAGRPVVIAIDEEGGDVTRLDTKRGSSSPGAAALGHLDDPATTEEVYAAIGDRLAEAGVTVDLAPVADVNVDPLNPVIGLRSFSADATTAARHVAAAVRGIQRSGVAACAKHFPGHGATRADSHHEVATLTRSREEIERVELEPFRAAIAAGTRAVMTGHLVATALDPDRLATVSSQVTTGLLREQLGFRGTVMTDALEMRAVSGTIGMVRGFVDSLVAGADAVETGALEHPQLLDELPAAVEAALLDGRLAPERLTEAAVRTAELSEPRGVPGGFDAAVVGAAAARCLEVVGPLPPLHRPVVLECRTPNGMATGDLPWSLGLLGTGSRVVPLTGPDTPLPELGDSSLVLVVRDPLRHPWQRELIALAERRPGSVVVDVGWPVGADTTAPLVRTRGIAPPLLQAAADLLGASATGAP